MSGFSIRGSVRRNNEDNISLNGKYYPANHDDVMIPAEAFAEGCRAGVFDGLGGELQGEMASYLAAKVFSESEDMDGDAEEYLMTLSKRMNEEVCSYMTAEKIKQMGTTMAAMFFENDKAYGMSLGDSRIYIYRDGRLKQLSNDHCFSRPGRLRRRLVMFLGASDNLEEMTPDVFKINVKAKDVFLICSDGVTDMIRNEKLEDIIREATDIDSCLCAIRDEVIRCGSVDNASMVIARAQ